MTARAEREPLAEDSDGHVVVAGAASGRKRARPRTDGAPQRTRITCATPSSDRQSDAVSPGEPARPMPPGEKSPPGKRRSSYACHYCQRTDGRPTRDHKVPKLFGGKGL